MLVYGVTTPIQNNRIPTLTFDSGHDQRGCPNMSMFTHVKAIIPQPRQIRNLFVHVFSFIDINSMIHLPDVIPKKNVSQNVC